AFIAGIMLISITIFPVIIGMGARTLFPEITDSRLALPTVIDQLLPDFVAGLVLAAVMAAIMSTANSILTAGTSHVINDLYLNGISSTKKKGNEKSDRYLLGLSRVWTLILGGIAILVATIIPSIVDGLLISYTLYTAGVFTPVVVGLLWKWGTVQFAFYPLWNSYFICNLHFFDCGRLNDLLYLIYGMCFYSSCNRTFMEKGNGAGCLFFFYRRIVDCSVRDFRV